MLYKNKDSMKNELIEFLEQLPPMSSKADIEAQADEILALFSVRQRLEMRKKASDVFEITKGYTIPPTDNAMKTALEMAHYVMVLTADLDGV